MISKGYPTPVLDVKVKTRFSGRPVRSRQKRRKGEGVGGKEGMGKGCGARMWA